MTRNSHSHSAHNSFVENDYSYQKSSQLNQMNQSRSSTERRKSQQQQSQHSQNYYDGRYHQLGFDSKMNQNGNSFNQGNQFEQPNQRYQSISSHSEDISKHNQFSHSHQSHHSDDFNLFDHYENHSHSLNQVNQGNHQEMEIIPQNEENIQHQNTQMEEIKEIDPFVLQYDTLCQILRTIQSKQLYHPITKEIQTSFVLKEYIKQFPSFQFEHLSFWNQQEMLKQFKLKIVRLEDCRALQGFQKRIIFVDSLMNSLLFIDHC